jgi:O-antigen/teichoic acid export membrane protein
MGRALAVDMAKVRRKAPAPFLPRVKLDVIVLIVVVMVVLSFAPGHGAWGWAVALLGAMAAGAAMGLIGRRYPGIYGRRRRPIQRR